MSATARIRGPDQRLRLCGRCDGGIVDDLCAVAGELGLLGIKGFIFQEGHDPDAAVAFREIARLTGGAYERFDASAPGALEGLLRAAAAYASGGVGALESLASGDTQARRLLTAMGRK
jgi:hypothetical protein